jgi:hypothetical protein
MEKRNLSMSGLARIGGRIGGDTLRYRQGGSMTISKEKLYQWELAHNISGLVALGCLNSMDIPGHF